MPNVAVVSGASSALGHAIVKRLSQHGLIVASLSRSSPDFPCDIRVQEQCDEQIRQVVSRLGPITLLVNCAGIGTDKLLIRSTADDFHAAYSTNVIGSMNLTRSCIRGGGMLKLKSGSIVNVGSVVGVVGNAGQSAYAASKAALIGASMSIAKEYCASNIRCNVICPGLIHGTKMWETLSDQQRTRFTDSSLLGRCATVDEIADGVHFLATNSYINSQVLVMDGGRR